MHQVHDGRRNLLIGEGIDNRALVRYRLSADVPGLTNHVLSLSFFLHATKEVYIGSAAPELARDHSQTLHAVSLFKALLGVDFELLDPLPTAILQC